MGLREMPGQKIINKFNAKEISNDSLIIPNRGKKVKVISVKDRELITTSFIALLKGNPDLSSDIKQDILKLVVLNRYESEPPGLAFIHNFNLKKGAMASSIAHDSHNIIATGVENSEIAECINWIISNRGGVAIHDGTQVIGLPLPIGGIISAEKAEYVAEKYKEINKIAHHLGCRLRSPFMTLSFMALLVIPELKLSNRGLFDGKNFRFTSLYEY
jgi:adenine deaminase